jgi:hypothetical protein
MAHTKLLGTTCSIHYDSPLAKPVETFDVIRTRAGTCYRVLEVRIQERGKHASGARKHLKCLRIAPEDVEADDKVHPLHWYSRNRRRQR